jgi:hypothetical protein
MRALSSAPLVAAARGPAKSEHSQMLGAILNQKGAPGESPRAVGVGEVSGW